MIDRWVPQGRRRNSPRPARAAVHPHATLDRVAVVRHFREVASLDQVDSPHVSRLLGSGIHEGRFFLAMELIPGISAQKLLDTRALIDD